MYRVELTKNDRKMVVFAMRSGEWKEEFRIRGEDKRLEVLGVFVVDEEEVLDLDLVLSHEFCGSQGEVYIKGIVKGKGVAKIKGLLRIGKDAPLSESFLRANILMESEQGFADVRPGLEILTDEVKASHAATIGRLDDEQIFYLQSRGVEENAAREILAQGFLNEVFSRVGDPQIVDKMKKELKD